MIYDNLTKEELEILKVTAIKELFFAIREKLAVYAEIKKEKEEQQVAMAK